MILIEEEQNQPVWITYRVPYVCNKMATQGTKPSFFPRTFQFSPKNLMRHLRSIKKINTRASYAFKYDETS